MGGLSYAYGMITYGGTDFGRFFITFYAAPSSNFLEIMILETFLG